MIYSMIYDDYDFGDEFFTGSFGFSGAGISTITVPGRKLELPGGVRISLSGGSWTVGGPGGGGTSPRDVAVLVTNQYERTLQDNLAKFNAGHISRSDALSNFDKIWEDYQQALAPVGSEEQSRALMDRSRGGRFDWFRAYRDPISQSSDVLPSHLDITEPLGVTSFLRNNLLWIVIIVGALFLFRR